jgi:hypothetical protein
MDLSNRDIAFLLWLGVGVIALFAWRPGRVAVRGILGALRGKLLLIALLYAGYFAMMVAGGRALGIWSTDLLKDTVAWFVLAGIPLLTKFPETYKTRGFFRGAARRLAGIGVAIEFLIGLTAFSLGAELLLLPAIVILGVLAAFAGTKPEYGRVKKVLDGVLGVLGLFVLVLTVVKLADLLPTVDLGQLMLLFFLPVWATSFTLLFVAVFGLYANYEPKMGEINRTAAGDRRARWRAKAALVGTFSFHSHELGRYAPFDARQLAETSGWREARRVVAFQRATIRFALAKQDLAAAKLVRYAGVEGTGWDDQPLDQREFVETQEALSDLAMLQRSQFDQQSRYSPDLEVGILVARKLPTAHGIVMKVNEKGSAWFAWRRTVGSWCIGVGASGPPPDQWTYGASEPPSGFPRKDAGWRRGNLEDGNDWPSPA